MARTKKKPADRKTEQLRIVMTQREKSIIESAAIAANMDVSTWVRVQILAMISRSS